MKYSKNFERDYNWYLSIKDIFNFDGNSTYTNKRGKDIIVNDKNGTDAKTAFYKYDTSGKIVPTKEPVLLRAILKTKGSINLHIKMYAEDRAKGILPKIIFLDLCKEISAPDWFYDAVENQKLKYY